MQLVLFSKSFNDKAPRELVDIARQSEADGYDVCIRQGHLVTPDNVGTELPRLTGFLREHGLDVPLASTETRLCRPDDPSVRPILQALAAADIRHLKIGYFLFNPAETSYAALLDQARACLHEWQRLSREYGVKICYHTHSGACLGMNAAGLQALLHGFDPDCIGAYIDPGHLVVNGEAFDTALAILKPHLGLVALKDVLLTRHAKNGHGSLEPNWVRAGNGMVDWTRVSSELRQSGYDGVYSVHCEFELGDLAPWERVVDEVRFFRTHLASPQTA